MAATMKFADNILKTFATSISIVLSCFLSFLLLGDLKLTSSFILGTAIIMAATFFYSKASEQLSTITNANSNELSVNSLNENDQRTLKGLYNAEPKETV